MPTSPIRRTDLVVLFCLVVSLVVTGCASPTGTPSRWAIDHVTVVDAVDGARVDQRVVVEGDAILWVGPVERAADGPEVDRSRVFDGTDRYLAPGLWDAHVHFLYDEALTEPMPDLFLDYGITSVRDTGGDLDRLVALRAGWREAGRATPRIYVAGPLLDGRRVVYDGEAAGQPPLGRRCRTSRRRARRCAASRNGAVT